MTKQIRVENADMSNYKVCVYEEMQQADGTWVRNPAPVALDYPTALHSVSIWKGKRLVIEEVE